MNSFVTCVHCGRDFKLSDALAHELAEETERIKKTVEEEARKKVRDEFEERDKAQKLELEEEKKKNRELIETFEKRKKEDEEKIREQTSKEASEKYRLEKLEYEKKINDMQKALEEAQRKGKQGSQQLQGDVLEQDLEERLRQAFPYDEFKPVPTGIRGGDIIQEVKNKYGNIAGTILWEAKRQKAWSKIWLAKLKDNMREINASDCILVSDNLPSNTKMYDRVENVWITSNESAIKLASVIRFGILNVAIIRSSASHTDEQLKDLYRIITSDSFRQMFEARDEIINALRLELEADKRSAEKRWRRQGAYIEKLDRNNSQLYGELQAHVPSLKPLKESETLELESGEEEENGS